MVPTSHLHHLPSINLQSNLHENLSMENIVLLMVYDIQKLPLDTFWLLTPRMQMRLCRKLSRSPLAQILFHPLQKGALGVKLLSTKLLGGCSRRLSHSISQLMESPICCKISCGGLERIFENFIEWMWHKFSLWYDLNAQKFHIDASFADIWIFSTTAFSKLSEYCISNCKTSYWSGKSWLRFYIIHFSWFFSLINKW